MRIDLPLCRKPSDPPETIEIQCHGCESILSVKIKSGLFKRKLCSQVSMVQHSQELLKIIEERRSYAKNNT